MSWRKVADDANVAGESPAAMDTSARTLDAGRIASIIIRDTNGALIAEISTPGGAA